MGKIKQVSAIAKDGEDSVGKRGRPVGDREAKRKEILNAGMRVIAQLGYSGMSLRKVAQQAGHTTGAVTYYFANKAEIVAALVEHMFDEFDSVLDAHESVTDVKARFKRWFEIESDSDLWLAQFQLLAQARHEPAFAEVFQRRFANYRFELAKILRAQQDAGEVRNDISAEILADQLSAMGDGWGMLLPIEHERFAPKRVEQLLEAIVTLISPPKK